MKMELDALETKAVELLRSRLDKASIKALNARVEPEAKDLVSVNGVFEDSEGHVSKFEVKFQVNQERAHVVSWYVSG